MNHSAALKSASTPEIRVTTLWIKDSEVRDIFKKYKITYSQTDGETRKEVDGVQVREQRTKEGTLGFVYHNALTASNDLWAVSKKDRKPFKLAKVG